MEETTGYDPKIRLPKGVSHGTIAALKAGCCCPKCLDRRKRARKRRLRI